MVPHLLIGMSNDAPAGHSNRRVENKKFGNPHCKAIPGSITG